MNQKFLGKYIPLIWFVINAMLQARAQENESEFVQFFYPNGQVSSEGTMRGGQPDGYWKTYYVTGVVKSEGMRTNYLLDSIWNFYNQPGELVVIGT